MNKKNKPGAGRPISTERKALLKKIEKLYKTKSYTEVAAELNISVHTVRNAVSNHGFKKDKLHWEKSWGSLVLSMWEKNKPEKIAKELNRRFGVCKSKWAITNKYRELAGLRGSNTPE